MLNLFYGGWIRGGRGQINRSRVGATPTTQHSHNFKEALVPHIETCNNLFNVPLAREEMSHMNLTDELTKAGISKTELASLLDVSRKTVTRMGESISPKVQNILTGLSEPKYTWLDTPISLFFGHGRGCAVLNPTSGGMEVLIARGGETEDSAVSYHDWAARLRFTCKHGKKGWGCKQCLK